MLSDDVFGKVKSSKSKFNFVNDSKPNNTFESAIKPGFFDYKISVS
jgi:hypothetical protein